MATKTFSYKNRTFSRYDENELSPEGFASGGFKSRKDLARYLQSNMPKAWEDFRKSYRLPTLNFSVQETKEGILIHAQSDPIPKPKSMAISTPYYVIFIGDWYEDDPKTVPYAYSPYFEAVIKMKTFNDLTSSKDEEGEFVVKGTSNVYYDVIDNKWYSLKDYLKTYPNLEYFIDM
jgi:hypothetical protein